MVATPELQGSETWMLNGIETRRVEGLNIKCLRRPLEVNVMNRIRNRDIREKDVKTGGVC